MNCATYYRSAVISETRKLANRIGELKKKLADEEKAIPDVMVMQEMAKPRDTFMLIRGQYDKKGEKVIAGTPAALPPLHARTRTANRLDLAQMVGFARASVDGTRHGKSNLANVLRHRDRQDGRGFRHAGRVSVAPGIARLARGRIPRIGLGRAQAALH